MAFYVARAARLITVSSTRTLVNQEPSYTFKRHPFRNFFFLFSDMHHQCAAPYVDISLHGGRFLARSTDSFGPVRAPGP